MYIHSHLYETQKIHLLKIIN